MSTLVTECSTMPVLRKLGIEAGSANKMLKVKATATNVNSARTWSRPNRSVPYLQWNVARKDKHTIQNANKQPHTKYTHNSEMKWINQFSVIFCESIVFAFIYMLVHFFPNPTALPFRLPCFTMILTAIQSLSHFLFHWIKRRAWNMIYRVRSLYNSLFR